MKLDFPGVNFNCSAVGVNVQCFPVVSLVFVRACTCNRKKYSLFDRLKKNENYVTLYNIVLKEKNPKVISYITCRNIINKQDFSNVIVKFSWEKRRYMIYAESFSQWW